MPGPPPPPAPQPPPQPPPQAPPPEPVAPNEFQDFMQSFDKVYEEGELLAREEVFNGNMEFIEVKS